MTPEGLDLAPSWLRIALIVTEIVTAVGAVGGAVMLIGQAGAVGFPDVGDTRLGALGFRSWAPGGALLALVVTGPMTAAAVLSLLHHPWAGLVTLLAGLALVCWIVVQVTFIGFASWLQPAFLLVGIAVALGGMSLVRAD